MAFISVAESDATHKHKRRHNPIFTENSVGLLHSNVHSYIYNHEKSSLHLNYQMQGGRELDTSN